jgi:WD40 repeat protein
MLTAFFDGAVRLWDLVGEVNSAVFSPDGTGILTVSSDKTAKLWDLKGGVAADFEHTGGVTSAVFSPDGTRILTCSDDKTAKLWYTPEAIYEWLKTANIPQLSREEKKELGIE